MDEIQTRDTPYEWQVPPEAMPESYRLAWCDEATQQGQAWFKTQRPAADIYRALDTIAGKDTAITPVAAYRSRINPNPLKRNVREIVGALAKLRPEWGYFSENKTYGEYADMMNKTTRAWYLMSFADRIIKEALQYAAVSGLGWVFPFYRRDFYGQGSGDIHLFSYGSPSVLPVQLPSNADWQSAYCMTLLDMMPVAMAHGYWPLKQNELRPSSSRYWYMDDGVKKSALANFGNIMQWIFGKKSRQAGDPSLAELLVPIRRQWIIDLAVNRTGRVLPMGEKGTSWYYEVPFVGQDLGSRKATANDARIYPYRRLIISSDRCILYDGPGFDWHGMFPGVPFSVDQWPWEPLGFSLIHDGYEINEGIKTIVRGDMDKVRAQLRPSMAYDTNAVAQKEAKDFDPYEPDARVGFDGQATEDPPLRPVLPAEFFRLMPDSQTLITLLQSMLDRQLGVNDVATLARLRAVGSIDELQKLTESFGPVVEDISRSMEPSMRLLGVMVKFLILQYYTTSRVMQIVGPDGVVKEVFDFKPESIVPSHMPGEDPKEESKIPAIVRARTFAKNLEFLILPNSLHEITQMTMKLLLIQLRKAGIMIDSQTIAEACNVPNYGKIDGKTVIERWKTEQEMQLEFAARMKELGESLSLGGPPGAAAPAAGKQNPEGRPPSGNAPPKIVSKDNGARSTITESK